MIGVIDCDTDWGGRQMRMNAQVGHWQPVGKTCSSQFNLLHPHSHTQTLLDPLGCTY